MPPNGRVIVGCTHGEEAPGRVAVSYLTRRGRPRPGQAV
jgi:hypothetical protein